MEIKKLAACDKEAIDKVVDIHLLTFEGFFLTFMGKGFLRQMYLSYLKHEASAILVAKEEDKILGFLAFSENLSGLYKYMIKHRLLQFAWYSFLAFLRKPRVFMRLVRAFLKPSESKREQRYVELASIGVRPDAKSRGVGSALIDALKVEVNFESFAYITLETDAVDNEAANRFYQKNGFSAVREFETHEGRKMIEYRFRGESKIEKAEALVHT